MNSLIKMIEQNTFYYNFIDETADDSHKRNDACHKHRFYGEVIAVLT